MEERVERLESELKELKARLHAIEQKGSKGAIEKLRNTEGAVAKRLEPLETAVQILVNRAPLQVQEEVRRALGELPRKA